MRDAKNTQGSLCQYVIATEEDTVRAPERLSLEEEAGFTVCALTAFGALNDAVELKGGDRVVINGSG